MQIPILSGITSNGAADFRTSYPRNLVPVPVAQGISTGYLRPADGIEARGTGPGIDRGGIAWNGVEYRVMGSKLVRISADHTITELGDVGAGGQVALDYSFDALAIGSGGALFYWDNAKLTRVTDPDLGTVVDMLWTGGYFVTTDGVDIIVTDLIDRTSVNPLKYGSSEADPDPVVSLVKLRKEVYALNRFTIEVFSNVGGDNFPFAPISGAQVPRGCIGTFACETFLGSIAFLGSGRNEAPAIWLVQAGDTLKLSTREIDLQLLEYTEAQLADVVMEVRVEKGHQHLLVHLPDQTIVYDGAASLVVGEPIWFTLTSSVVGKGAYRARNLVRCYDRWNVADPTSSALGVLTAAVSTHYGATVGWEFGTQIVYNEGRGLVVHSVELVSLTGRAVFGANPTLWTSYSLDGEVWSQEKPISGGKAGDRAKRLQWRNQGSMQHWRMQRFRGTSDFRGSFARLEIVVEPLHV